MRQQWLYWTLVVVGAVALGFNFATGTGRIEWMPFGTAEQILFVLALAGLGVTWWARLEPGTRDNAVVRSAIRARLAILRAQP